MINKDIQYCAGRGCLLRDTCKRAKDEKTENEVWFADEPFRIVEGKFHCDLYWANNQIDIFKNEEHGQTGADKQTDGRERGIGKETKGD